MNTEYILLFTVIITFLLLLLQRTERKKRLIVLIVLALPALLIRNWIAFRDLEQEGIIAFGIALVLNFVFWLFIGRYNPVTSSDEIQVLGLDD